MKNRKLPSRKELQKYIAYDPETGIFTSLVNSLRYGKKRGFKIGEPAGYEGNGYNIIFVCGRKISAHRLAWLFMTGKWPREQIDHINGNRADNRFSNLREASTSQNMMNRAPRGRRRFKGIWFDKQTGQWRVQLKKNGSCISPGRFDNEIDAAISYNYHSAYLHGEFARLNAIPAGSYIHEFS